ncbi:hypothetical protein SK128_011772 [Halocaridina rubra]|uniref:Uncharacterized protein n=1 Tax=Halocaridina rubra TaxID=373956 RepID=A0AAN8XFJ8_HALRR
MTTTMMVVVQGYSSLMAWMKQNQLSTQREHYDVRELMQEVQRTFYEVEEYDFNAYYPTLYKHLLKQIVDPQQHAQYRYYQELFQAAAATTATTTDRKQEKKILNIIYGLFHCDYSIFYCRELGLMVRVLASKIMTSVYRDFKDDIIYGYVDSLFFIRVDNTLNGRLAEKLSSFNIDQLRITPRNRFREITFFAKTSYVATLEEGGVIRKGVVSSDHKDDDEKKKYGSNFNFNLNNKGRNNMECTLKRLNNNNKVVDSKYGYKDKNAMVDIYKKMFL